MYSHSIFIFLASILASLPLAHAGFSSSSSTNVAVYWGAYRLPRDMYETLLTFLQDRILRVKQPHNNDYHLIVQVSA